MTTTELITPTADRGFRDMALETLTLVSVVPFYGPPAVVLAGPLVLFALMVAGAFTALLTLVVLLLAAAALVGLTGAILASPYLLVRSVRGHRSPHASSDAHAVQPGPVQWRRVVA